MAKKKQKFSFTREIVIPVEDGLTYAEWRGILGRVSGIPDVATMSLGFSEVVFSWEEEIDG